MIEDLHISVPLNEVPEAQVGNYFILSEMPGEFLIIQKPDNTFYFLCSRECDIVRICESFDWYIVSRNMLCRLSALLLLAVFNLWSLLWFSTLPTLGTYEAEYERTGVLPENMIPSNENNFYFCWIVGAVIILYLVVAMTISYVMKLYAGSKRFTDKWTGSRQPCNKHL